MDRGRPVLVPIVELNLGEPKKIVTVGNGSPRMSVHTYRYNPDHYPAHVLTNRKPSFEMKESFVSSRSKTSRDSS